MRFLNMLFIFPILYGAFSCKENAQKRPSKASHIGEVKSLDTIRTDSSSVSYPGSHVFQVYTWLKNGNKYWPWLFKIIDLKMYLNIAKENPEWDGLTDYVKLVTTQDV